MRGARIFAVVGTPGSGKDLLVRAVNDLGAQHAQIVPKHTSRQRNKDDGTEMICVDDPTYNMGACDIVYENFRDTYGIATSRVWSGVAAGISQVIVVSNTSAINQLRQTFGGLVVLVYVHSEQTAAGYAEVERSTSINPEYVANRAADYQKAFRLYLRNYHAFRHVLIYAGIKEDLYDQIFRLFRAYETGDLT
jgi:ribose 1,5-bisphosphokinase PhnN